jgi:hypothetical protein
MKIRYLTLALLIHSMVASGQADPDSAYQKQRISKTDIQTFFGFYVQNGNHSAITGGIGTEQLKVYSPQFTITHQADSNHTFSINGGVDIITSASMDNIDFVVSSASKVSARVYLFPSYQFKIRRTHTYLGFSTGFSSESAYQSLPVGISAEHRNTFGVTRWSAAINCNFDNLLWGLIQDYGRPVELIYPYELRDTSWFSIYRRQSYNLDLAFYQVINKRMQLAIYPELVYQHGLLSTPYHRVYFNDQKGTERVENLPLQRWKVPFALQWNAFVGGRTILRLYYRWYWDDWGIQAQTLQLEAPIKLNPTFSLAPLLRFYTQTAAFYFRPYKEHSLTEAFYTSDYDLSKFHACKAGLTLRYAPQKSFTTHFDIDAISLRYDFYKRSEGLSADIISLLLDLGHTKVHKKAPGNDSPGPLTDTRKLY